MDVVVLKWIPHPTSGMVVWESWTAGGGIGVVEKDTKTLAGTPTGEREGEAK